MPGPKMGPRPHDFDEHVIRMSPTFLKWMQLQPGQKLRYACREFVKDKGDDEERLMRRIMIARRNNIRDHETLKKARKITSKTGNTLAEEDAGDERVAVPTPQQTTLPQPDEPTVTRTAPTETMNHQLGATELVTTPPDLIGATTVTTTTPAALGSDDDNYTTTTTNSVTVAATTTTTTTTGAAAPATSSSISTAASTSRRRRSAPVFSDQQVEQEMDVPAVEATRSYRAWADLPEGHEFVYNQKYIKGREGHDWLLRKNIWRRMRYRRENKKMVERLKKVPRLAGAGGHVHDHMTSGDESGSEQAPPLAFSPEDYRKEQLPLEQSERNAKKNHGTAGGAAGAGSDVTVGTNEDGTLGDATAARDPSHVPSVNVTVGAAMKIEAPSAIMKMEPEEDAVMAAPSHEIDHDETTNHHLVAAAAAAASSSSGDDHHLAADPDAVAAAVAAAATFGTNESAGDGCAGETDMITSTAAVSTTSSSSSLLLSSTATGAILPHHSLLAPPPEHDEAHAAALDAAAQLAAATTVHRAKKDQNHGGDGNGNDNGDDNNDDDDVNVALHVAADVAMAAVGDHTDLYHSMNEAAVAAAAAVVASASELEEV